MTTSKTLMLAGVAALSLGVASANAQSLTPSAGQADYFSSHNSGPAKSTDRSAAQIQSGSSDVEMTGSGRSVGTPGHFDYSTLANPG